jgi:hypothetical protein
MGPGPILVGPSSVPDRRQLRRDLRFGPSLPAQQNKFLRLEISSSFQKKTLFFSRVQACTVGVVPTPRDITSKLPCVCSPKYPALFEV